MATSIDAKGSGSVTVAGQSGKTHTITKVHAAFGGSGSSGTLYLKQGSTVVWSASVSGGLSVEFPEPKAMATGASVTLELSGAQVMLLGQTS